MSTEITVQEQITPMQMIQVAFDAAIKQGSAMEVVNAILAQQKWMILHQEEQEFNEAMDRIQNELGVVVKDAAIPGKGKYASSKAVDKAIRNCCKKERINLSFDTEKSDIPDVLVFVCDVTRGPYKKRYTLPLPVDGTGAKGGGVMNRTDATLAAVTKGKRYLKNMIFNLRIEETDDEGEADGISNDEGFSLIEEIRACTTPEATMGAWKKAIDIAKSREKIDYRAMTILTEARDEKLKELRKAK
jgi:hypothetical protein